MKVVELLNCIEPWDKGRDNYRYFVPKFIEEASSGEDWSEWDKDVFYEFFERSNDQCVSSLQQGYFTNEEKQRIKDNWSSISELLKEIAEDQNNPNWECYESLKSELRKCTTQNKKASTHRMVASLQPKLLTTIVSDDHLKELLNGLRNIVDDDVPTHSWNWFRCSYETLQFFKKHLDCMDYMNMITYPWQIREHISGKTLIDIIRDVNSSKNMKDLNTIKDILFEKKQIILQGAPGTGKTYSTAALALSIIDESYNSTSHEKIMERYQELVDAKRIFFTTFHQSMDYEDFVEGLRPEVVDGNVSYSVKDGIFKIACSHAEEKDSMTDIENAIEKLKEKCSEETLTLKTTTGVEFSLSYRGGRTFSVRSSKSQTEEGRFFPVNINSIKEHHKNNAIKGYNQSYITGICKYLTEIFTIKPYDDKTVKEKQQNYVLIIDEINRGNISKIFGELITLLESDKRQGGAHMIPMKLTYSNKADFTVPSNLYIIGTMNTTDRSVGHIDYAVRRRFAFYTLKADKSAVESFYLGKDILDDTKDIAIELFGMINTLITTKKSPELDAEDLMVGHSYFMAETIDKLKMKLEYEIIPLLREYEKDGILSISIKDLRKQEMEWKSLFINKA